MKSDAIKAIMKKKKKKKKITFVVINKMVL